MDHSKKTFRHLSQPAIRETVKTTGSSDSQHPVWSFERVDRSGVFAFSMDNDSLDSKLILQKLVDLSGLTWQEIKQQTHDRGRSKNHFITEADQWSPEARKRFDLKCSPEESDSVFSIALNNRCRLIGIRVDRAFYVIWYDPEHRFYPVTK